MTDHIDAEIADYLEGRLTPERMDEVRRHLDECEECAADVAWARQLVDRALDQGRRPHLPAERIVAITEGGENPDDDEIGHLEHCPECRAEIEWARRQAPVDTLLAEIEAKTPAPVATPGMATVTPITRPATEHRRRFGWHWTWGAAAAVAAAALAVVMFLPGGDVTPPVPVPTPTPSPAPAPAPPVTSIASLARIESLPVQLTRSPADPGSFDESRMLGLEAYQEGAYDSAAAHFRRALARQPDDEVRLYLGSAELLRRNVGVAVPLLEDVASRATDPTLLSETLWQLANALLLIEERDAALAAARRLAALGARHRAEAESLVAGLDAAALVR